MAITISSTLLLGLTEYTSKMILNRQWKYGRVFIYLRGDITPMYYRGIDGRPVEMYPLDTVVLCSRRLTHELRTYVVVVTFNPGFMKDSERLELEHVLSSDTSVKSHKWFYNKIGLTPNSVMNQYDGLKKLFYKEFMAPEKKRNLMAYIAKTAFYFSKRYDGGVGGRTPMMRISVDQSGEIAFSYSTSACIIKSIGQSMANVLSDVSSIAMTLPGTDEIEQNIMFTIRTPSGRTDPVSVYALVFDFYSRICQAYGKWLAIGDCVVRLPAYAPANKVVFPPIQERVIDVAYQEAILSKLLPIPAPTKVEDTNPARGDFII